MPGFLLEAMLQHSALLQLQVKHKGVHCNNPTQLTTIIHWPKDTFLLQDSSFGALKGEGKGTPDH